MNSVQETFDSLRRESERIDTHRQLANWWREELRRSEDSLRHFQQKVAATKGYIQGHKQQLKQHKDRKRQISKQFSEAAKRTFKEEFGDSDSDEDIEDGGHGCGKRIDEDSRGGPGAAGGGGGAYMGIVN